MSRNDVILGVAAAVLVVFSLVVSIVIPRRDPGFPGKSIGIFTAVAITLVVIVLASVEIFGESHEAEGSEGGGESVPAETDGGEGGGGGGGGRRRGGGRGGLHGQLRQLPHPRGGRDHAAPSARTSTRSASTTTPSWRRS